MSGILRYVKRQIKYKIPNHDTVLRANKRLIFQKKKSFETSARTIDVSCRARLRGKEVRSFRKKGRSGEAPVYVNARAILASVFQIRTHTEYTRAYPASTMCIYIYI